MPEGDKLAKHPRGHVITGLLQFELFLCRVITERTRLTFLWIPANAFLFGKNRRNAKACSIKSDLSVNNDVIQTDRVRAENVFHSTDWALKVHLA